MKISGIYYVAYEQTGELYQTNKARYLFSNLGHLKNSVTSQYDLDDEMLEKFLVAEVSIYVGRQIVSLKELKETTQSIRQLEREIDEREEKIENLAKLGK